MCLISYCILSLKFLSNAPKGSSIKNAFGLLTIALPKATLCLSPPDKLETLEYFERLVRLQELQKRASSRLFFERPILSMLRAMVYLPTHIWKYIDRKYDRFYVSKLKNEIEVLRIEIKHIQKRRWTK